MILGGETYTATSFRIINTFFVCAKKEHKWHYQNITHFNTTGADDDCELFKCGVRFSE